MGVRGAPWGVTEVHSFFNEEMINQMTNPLKIKKMGVTNEKMGIRPQKHKNKFLGSNAHFFTCNAHFFFRGNVK